MFSYAAALVVESFYKHVVGEVKKVIYHGNEWMTGLGLLYIKKNLPQIATIFTTHATSIGRSIAGNNKPLTIIFLLTTVIRWQKSSTCRVSIR